MYELLGNLPSILVKLMLSLGIQLPSWSHDPVRATLSLGSRSKLTKTLNCHLVHRTVSGEIRWGLGLAKVESGFFAVACPSFSTCHQRLGEAFVEDEGGLEDIVKARAL